MPLVFTDRDGEGDSELYLQKLNEMVQNEDQFSQIDSEIVAEKDVEFEFEERLKIYSRLKMKVSKKNQKYLRKNALLRVVIKQLCTNRHAENTGQSYVGTGKIKKVVVKQNDPFLQIILQLDIGNVRDKKKE